jgi:hypothetical protein
MTFKRRGKVLLLYAAGLIGLAVFLWGAAAMMKARPYLPEQVTRFIVPPTIVPDTIAQTIKETATETEADPTTWNRIVRCNKDRCWDPRTNRFVNLGKPR